LRTGFHIDQREIDGHAASLFDVAPGVAVHLRTRDRDRCARGVKRPHVAAELLVGQCGFACCIQIEVVDARCLAAADIALEDDDVRIARQVGAGARRLGRRGQRL
jgi:hypothetical protein